VRAVRLLLAKVLALLATAGAAIAAVTVGSGGGSGGSSPAPPDKLAHIRADKLLGQRIMVGFSGTSADRALLARIRAGHVGSVILFSQNIGSRSQLTALTRSLQQAARAGGNPPLLIATDQEGGQVKRLPSGPPDLSPPQIVASGRVSVATHEGSATGRYLHSLGINWDLAPVVDVPTTSSAFIWRQGRAFSFDAATVAKYATPFAVAMQSAGVAAAAKHFPGDGSAIVDTDTMLDELHPTLAQRRAALVPYQALITRGVDAIMITTAGFRAYDRSGTPAALSRQIVQGVLRKKLGFTGVAITDALGAPTGHDEITAGVMAAHAGADVLLYTDSATGELRALEHALRTRALSRSEAEASYQRIVTLKRRLTGR
jgi:beta-N-acetylhexosaminidase